MAYKLFSVDDHLLEPHDLWTSRVPSRYRDVCLRVDVVDGVEQWVFEDTRSAVFMQYASAGIPQDKWTMDPIALADMHPACWDATERSKALRSDGIVGSITFPTAPGFGGRVFAVAKDKTLADLSVKAYNDFMFDQWCAADPDLFVPTILCQLWDPQLAADEVRRCADRGARALSFPENPYPLGLPSIHSESWDPLWNALTDTGVVIAAHGGASGRAFMGSPDSHFMNAIVGAPATCGSEVITDLIFSRVPRLFPEVQWVLAEVGAGYLPYLLERAEYMWEKQRAWHGFDERPREIFRRNIYVPLVNERFAVEQRHLIGVSNLLWESDFPHPETMWPNSQAAVEKEFAGVPDDEVAAITHGNAAKLLRWVV